MARNLHYTIPFKNIDQQSCVINIYTEGYEGSSIELTAASNPISYSETNKQDTVGVPIRHLSGYIRVIDDGTEALNMVARSKFHHFVEFKVDNRTAFVGYIQVAQFSQDMQPMLNEIELPIISPLGLLEGGENLCDGIDVKNIAWYLYNASTYVYEYTTFAFKGGDKEFSNLSDKWHSKIFAERRKATEEDSRTVICKNHKEIVETICNYYGWTVRDNGTELLFDKAENTLVRSFNKDYMLSVSNGDSAYSPTIIPGYSSPLLDSFDSFNDKKWTRMLGVGYKKVIKNYSAPSYEDSWTPDFSDVDYESLSWRLNSYANRHGETYIRFLEFSETKLSLGEEFEAQLHFTYDDYDSREATSGPSGGYPSYGPKHKYNFTHAFIINKDVSYEKWLQFKPVKKFSWPSGHYLTFNANIQFKPNMLRDFNTNQCAKDGSFIAARIKYGNKYWNGTEWKSEVANCSIPIGSERNSVTGWASTQECKILSNRALDPSHPTEDREGYQIPSPGGDPDYLQVNIILLCLAYPDPSDLNPDDDPWQSAAFLVSNIKFELRKPMGVSMKDSKIEEYALSSDYNDILELDYNMMPRLDIGPFSGSDGATVINDTTKGTRQKSYYDAADILKVKVKGATTSKSFSKDYTIGSTEKTFTTDLSVFNANRQYSYDGNLYHLLYYTYNAIDNEYELTLRKLS